MRWSWKLIEVKGTAVFIHWTFLILPAWIFIAYRSTGAGTAEALKAVALVLAIFACIVLHELGHALTARRFGIRTRDITLFPIGGVARMERIPEDPSQELWIAVAGPAVNVAIAGALFGLIGALGGIGRVSRPDLVVGSFLANLAWANVVLVVFNLLPAFPMDGGRVLRALLARRTSYVQATQIASSVGQVTAILIGVLGFIAGNWLLIFIALFVYIGAQEEAHLVRLRAVLGGVPAREAMVTRFVTLAPADPVQRAVDELLAGYQHDFPVVESDRLVGILTRQDILRALASGVGDADVSQFMRGDCPVAQETDTLEVAVPRLQESGSPAIAVVRGGRLTGLLTTENLSEWLMVRSARPAESSGKPPTPKAAGSPREPAALHTP